jgi:plastocyanin
VSVVATVHDPKRNQEETLLVTKIPALVLLVVALALGLTACGGSSSSSSTASSSATATSSAAAASTSASASAPAGGAALALAADPSGALKYTTTSLTAKAGKVTIQFTNSSPLAHNITIQAGTSGATIGATPTFQGGSKTLSVTLKPGTYTFFCSVPGHRAAGMQGTITVS